MKCLEKKLITALWSYDHSKLNQNLNHFKSPTTHQDDNWRTLLQLLQDPFVGSDTLNQGNRKRIKLIGLMGLVNNGQWDPEAQVLQVSNLLWELDDLGQEVDPELEGTSSSGSSSDIVDGENSAGNNEVSLLDFSRPVIKDFLFKDLWFEWKLEIGKTSAH